MGHELVSAERSACARELADRHSTAWQALFVPAKTPPEIVRKISADTNTALADTAIKDKLLKTG